MTRIHTVFSRFFSIKYLSSFRIMTFIFASMSHLSDQLRSFVNDAEHILDGENIVQQCFYDDLFSRIERHTWRFVLPIVLASSNVSTSTWKHWKVPPSSSSSSSLSLLSGESEQRGTLVWTLLTCALRSKQIPPTSWFVQCLISGALLLMTIDVQNICLLKNPSFNHSIIHSFIHRCIREVRRNRWNFENRK